MGGHWLLVGCFHSLSHRRYDLGDTENVNKKITLLPCQFYYKGFGIKSNHLSNPKDSRDCLLIINFPRGWFY
jgi:hypothetical protein